MTVNIKPKLGVIKLPKLHPQATGRVLHVVRCLWQSSNGKGLSPQTVLHIHRLLRKALQPAVIWQLRATTPADAIDAPCVPEREMQAVDKERLGVLMEAAEGTDM